MQKRNKNKYIDLNADECREMDTFICSVISNVVKQYIVKYLVARSEISQKKTILVRLMLVFYNNMEVLFVQALTIVLRVVIN